MTNQEVITQFYTAFAAGDASKMTSFYDDNIEFEDPAFGKLYGEKAKAMWKMLCERSKGDLKISFSNVAASDTSGSVDWVAQYNFGPKRRNVTNHVKAEFTFSNGKIVKHTDDFSFKNWSRQALGFKGWLLGGTRFLRNKVQETTNSQLKKYINRISKNPELG